MYKYDATYYYTSRKGVEREVSRRFDRKKDAVAWLEATIKCESHNYTKDPVVERVEVLNQYAEELLDALKTGKPVHYITPGYYSKGWAHAHSDHLSQYKAEAEKLGLELVDFGNDSPSGRAIAGVFFHVASKEGR